MRYKHLTLPAIVFDLMAASAFYFAIQWFLALSMVNPAQLNKITASPRIEIIVSAVWPDINEDLDLWIYRVDHDACGWNRRDVSLFRYHGDHVSAFSGQVDGKNVDEAVETIGVLQKAPGTYRIAVHGYRVSKDNEPITVEVEHVDPYKRICKIQTVCENSQEVSICEFTINSKLEIVPESIITDPDLLTPFLHIVKD